MVEVKLYRKQNPDGTSKDWAYPCQPQADGLTVYYGRTGSVLRLSHTPTRQCQHGSPEAEGQARAFSKVRDGYQSLGAHRLAPNRRDLTPIGVTSNRPVTSPPPHETAERGIQTTTPPLRLDTLSDEPWFY